MNHYAKKKGFSMSKNEATVQQTAITKKLDEITKEIEKLKGYNSAKKWKIKILKKRPRDIH